MDETRGSEATIADAPAPMDARVSPRPGTNTAPEPADLHRAPRSTEALAPAARTDARHAPEPADPEPADSVPADPEPTAPERADPRAALLAERARVLEELEELRVEAPGPMTYGSQAAAASHVFEQQRDLALRDRTEQHLVAVEAALARLDDGSWGTCTECGRPIGEERLVALPSAALCIDCQRTTRRR